MKLLKIFILAVGFSSAGTFAQDVVVEDLPVATISTNFYVTLPEVPLVEDYYIDISHMDFEDSEDAVNQFFSVLKANLTTPAINYEEGYVILHVHTEFMGDDLDLVEFQTYLGQLARPE